MLGYEVQQSTTAFPLVFLLVQSSDHITGATGLTPTVTISKNGGAFASPSGAVSEIGNGWYKVAGNATDTSTLGPLILHASGTGADPTDPVFPVVVYNPQSTSLGLSLAKGTNITGLNDIAATAIVSSGAITTSSGAVVTITNYTGNTPQTGDSFARIGATGSSLTSLAPAATALSTAQWTNTRASDLDNLDAAVSSRLATSAYTAPLTGPQTATAVWTDQTDSGDFALGDGSVIGNIVLTALTNLPQVADIVVGMWTTTNSGGLFNTANSIGKLLYNSASQSGDSYARLGAPTGASIDADILSRLASSAYTAAPSAATVAAASAAAIAAGSVGSVTSAVAISMAQAVPTSNTAQTVGDALNAARAQGFGKWAISGTTLTLYAADGSTTVRTFTLDSATAPTQRS